LFCGKPIKLIKIVKLKKNNKGFIFIALLLICSFSFAQVRNENIRDENLTEKFHSPKKAAFFSALLPGLGQAYNKKSWKIPIIYAGAGALIYAIQFNNTQYLKFKTGYCDFIDTIPGTDSYLDLTRLDPDSFNEDQKRLFRKQLIDYKDFYRKYRDLSIIGMVGLYILNIVDASVDANLFDYDIGNDLTFIIEPSFPDPIFRHNFVGLKFSFYF